MQAGARKAIVVGVGLILLLVMLRLFNVHSYFTLDALKQISSTVSTFVDQHYVTSLFMYGIMYGVVVACAIPVVGPMTLFGGFLFDTVLAVFISTAALTLGATMSFLVIRYVLQNIISKKMEQKRQLFAAKIQLYGSSYLLTLNLVTIVPFFVISSFAAMTHVPLTTFIWTACVGSLPMIVVYAYAGTMFASITSLSDIFSPSLISAFVLLIILSLLPIILKRMQFVNHL